MEIYKKLILLVAFSSASIMLAGCSSGDGKVGYTGNLSPAKITSDNSADIANAVIDGASSSGVAASANGGGGGSEDKKQLLGLATTIGSAVSRMEPVDNGGGSNATVYSERVTVEGDCGGILAYNSSYDDVSGDFHFKADFSEFQDCESGSYLDGSFSMSATGRAYDGTAGEYYYATATVSFGSLKFVEGAESMTMTGKMVMSMTSATVYSVTMNFDFRDNAKGETYRLQNYVVSVTEDATGEDLSISGRAYHHYHGYVDISTTTTIRANYADIYPSAGVVVLTGAGGSNVRVTFTSNNTYTLAVDSDGNASYESTLSCTWSPAECN